MRLCCGIKLVRKYLPYQKLRFPIYCKRIYLLNIKPNIKCIIKRANESGEMVDIAAAHTDKMPQSVGSHLRNLSKLILHQNICKHFHWIVKIRVGCWRCHTRIQMVNLSSAPLHYIFRVLARSPLDSIHWGACSTTFARKHLNLGANEVDFGILFFGFWGQRDTDGIHNGISLYLETKYSNVCILFKRNAFVYFNKLPIWRASNKDNFAERKKSGKVLACQPHI